MTEKMKMPLKIKTIFSKMWKSGLSSNKLDRDVDLTVVLSHSGLGADQRIAKELPPECGVDIIIGGHSHDLMEKTEVINGIIICQAVSKG